MPKDIRELVFKMMAQNPTWRAPRIHGELVMLGFDISERSVSRWMRRAPRIGDGRQRWLTFLGNHREASAAMDFFTMPTATFSMLYCFFIIGHDRRRILYFNVTHHPTTTWIVQQLREAFPFEPSTKFLSSITTPSTARKCPAAIRGMGIAPTRTAIGCPWQI